MKNMLRSLLVIGASTATLGVVGVPAATAAADWEITYPAGQVCSFPLVIAGSGAGAQVNKVFTDRDGNVRTLSAGTGYELTFTNGDTGATMTTPSNGGAGWTQSAANGSSILEVLGHNVIFLFPTDVGGPSTTLYTGRVVITVDPSGTWTVVQKSGRSIDICASLSTAG